MNKRFWEVILFSKKKVHKLAYDLKILNLPKKKRSAPSPHATGGGAFVAINLLCSQKRLAGASFLAQTTCPSQMAAAKRGQTKTCAFWSSDQRPDFMVRYSAFLALEAFCHNDGEYVNKKVRAASRRRREIFLRKRRNMKYPHGRFKPVLAAVIAGPFRLEMAGHNCLILRIIPPLRVKADKNDGNLVRFCYGWANSASSKTIRKKN
ncbi:MAG: hypothetical protein LBJ64_00135 [Deltaproteobacteria bacterium]|nr:hypothetical protein [Deltaproteobacteria bacterium]